PARLRPEGRGSVGDKDPRARLVGQRASKRDPEVPWAVSADDSTVRLDQGGDGARLRRSHPTRPPGRREAQDHRRVQGRPQVPRGVSLKARRSIRPRPALTLPSGIHRNAGTVQRAGNPAHTTEWTRCPRRVGRTRADPVAEAPYELTATQ